MEEIIGGRPGPTITIYSPKKQTFSFFYLLSGVIRMTITTDNKETVVVFESLEDFEKRAVEKGLPSQFVGTISRAYQ